MRKISGTHLWPDLVSFWGRALCRRPDRSSARRRPVALAVEWPEDRTVPAGGPFDYGMVPPALPLTDPNAAAGSVMVGTAGSGGSLLGPSGATATSPLDLTGEGNGANGMGSQQPVAWQLTMADQSNVVGDTVAAAVAVSGTPDGPLTFYAFGLPPGLNIDSASGVISGTIPVDLSSGGYFTVSVWASGTTNGPGTCQFHWTVDSYPAYVAAVTQAQPAYAAAVQAAAATRDAAMDGAWQMAQAAADGFYQNYQSAVASATAQFDVTEAALQSTYESAVQTADGLRQPSLDQANAVYNTAMASAQAYYGQETAAAAQAYQDAKAAADAAYAAAVAPYQAAWEQAAGAAQANPQDPDAQANLAQAAGALATATSGADVARTAAYAAAQATQQAAMASAAQDLAAAQDTADVNFTAVMSDPDQAWQTAEGSATDAWQAGSAAAAAAWDSMEGLSWTMYTQALAQVNANLTATVAGTEAQYTAQLAAALGAWNNIEQSSWNVYTTAQANNPNPPPLGQRITAPTPVQGSQTTPPSAQPPQSRVGQPPRPFGGALQLRGGQLVMPDTYEIEDSDRELTFRYRIRRRLGVLVDRLRVEGYNISGVLTGDIFDSSAFEYFNNLQANQNAVLITINGVLSTQQDAQALLNSIAAFGPNIPRVAVGNGTYGLGDAWQAVQNTLGAATIADLRAAVQIELAAQALRRVNAPNPRIIVVAHSQGTEVFYRALNFLSPQTKAMIEFHGLGGQRFVANDLGLLSADNFYFSDDPIPFVSNANPLRRWYAVNHQFTVYRIPAAPGGSRHTWANNYERLFNSPNGITPPPGTRAIRYGGGPFPFAEMRGLGNN